MGVQTIHGGPELQNDPVYQEINEIVVARMRQLTLKALYLLFLKNPDRWNNWEAIREHTKDEQEGVGRDHINHRCRQVQNELNKREESETNGLWKIALASEKINRLTHWKLIVEPRSNQERALPSTNRTTVPTFAWEIGDYKNSLLVWLPCGSELDLEVTIRICGEWQVPSNFDGYDEFKLRKWKKLRTADKDDTPICAYSGLKKLQRNIFGFFPIELDASIARYSDYVATNGQILEWLQKEGESKRVQNFKNKLGLIEGDMHFSPHAANPITILVNLITADNQLVLTRISPFGRWISPASGLVDPFLDIQRGPPFCICPNETAIRTAYQNLGVPLHRKSIRWNTVALHRESGILTLIGEVETGLDQDSITAMFKSLSRPSTVLGPTFVDLNPVSVVQFLEKYETLHVLEISLALYLKRKCSEIKIAWQ